MNRRQFFADPLDISDMTAKAANDSSSGVKGAMADAYDWTRSTWDDFIDLF